MLVNGVESRIDHSKPPPYPVADGCVVDHTGRRQHGAFHAVVMQPRAVAGAPDVSGGNVFHHCIFQGGSMEKKKVGSVEYHEAGAEYFAKRQLRKHARVW
jgi:hypothetical protein